MQPRTLLGITLELVGRVAAPGPYPADARVGRFFRSKRFLGSRDRRLLGDAVFAWLRHGLRARARWSAWAASVGRTPAVAGGEAEARLLHLLDVLALAADGLLPFDLATAREGARAIAAEASTAGEGAGEILDLVERAIDAPDWPGDAAWPEDPADRLAAELSLPRWLAGRLSAERGEDGARALGSALLAQAPVDLRVNTARTSRETARRSLEKETGAGVEPTPLSPIGLRIARRRNLTGTTASREGWIEVEDEGSQLTVLSLDAAPGMDVIDACAGAGGKALALAGILFGGEPPGGGRAGSLTACDVSREKLGELERRARDAGIADRIRRALIAPEGPLPAAIGPADLVLVDAPCSGLGTLRRNPELKLRHGPEDVRAHARLQRAILERFLPLVKPGGRIAYATCSILAEENEEVAAAFAAAHPGLEEVASTWAATHLPAACREGTRLRIDPVTAGTDGFFVAMWRRTDDR
jgi:16S rRNA (cytosine967-C5)-methyltransferase